MSLFYPSRAFFIEQDRILEMSQKRSLKKKQTLENINYVSRLNKEDNISI